jgi:hypothetical protein
MTLAEKCWLIAVYADLPRAARDRLLSFAETPESGLLIGGALSGKFQDGRLAIRVKPSLLDN